MTEMTIQKTVGCTFGPGTQRIYTYKYDPVKVGRELQVGDSVNVETKDGQKTITVAEVHAVPQTEDKFPFKEILSWVDPKNEV